MDATIAMVQIATIVMHQIATVAIIATVLAVTMRLKGGDAYLGEFVRFSNR
jgi:hypothetical protein